MTRRLVGIPAAPGAAAAPPWRYQAEVVVGPDVLSLDAAATSAAAQLEELAATLRTAGNPDEAGIMEAQALMAADETLLAAARSRIAAGATVSAAIVAAGEELAAMLAGLDDELLAARAADVRDVARRIAAAAVGAAAPRLEQRSIAIARDLPPSVTAELQRELLAGIALEAGSRTAHAAILARALGIPAVVGVGGLLEAAATAELVGLDGEGGEVLVDPGPAEVDQLRQRGLAAAAARRADGALAAQPLRTADGYRVMLGANIGRPEEAAAALTAGAEGIGLFRTEFMFMGRQAAPDEETQAAAYAQVLAAFDPRPVVIRLIDLGGDKDLPYLGLPREENPFLGVRAIRLARRDPELQLTQLRAILRAAARTRTTPWVMAPMVADADDVALLHDLCDRAAAAVPDRVTIRRGIMVEIPSAALLAADLAARVDFMSIGTNDLTQYLLAADRTSAELAAYQDGLHPAVIRAVRATVEGARAAGIPVAVCGELAGDPAGAVLLAGLGVDELSMDAAAFAAVKRALGSVSVGDAASLAARAADAAGAAAVRAMVAELLAAPVATSG